MSVCKPKSVKQLNDEFEQLYSRFQGPSSQTSQKKDQTQIDEEFEELYMASPASKMLEQVLSSRPMSSSTIIRPKSVGPLVSPKAMIIERMKLQSPSSSVPPKAFVRSPPARPSVPSTPVNRTAEGCHSRVSQEGTSPVKALTPVFVAQNRKTQEDAEDNPEVVLPKIPKRPRSSHRYNTANNLPQQEGNSQDDELKMSKKNESHSYKSSKRRSLRRTRHTSRTDVVTGKDTTDSDERELPDGAAQPGNSHSNHAPTEVADDTEHNHLHSDRQTELSDSAENPDVESDPPNPSESTDLAQDTPISIEEDVEDEDQSQVVDESKAIVLDDWVIQAYQQGVRIEGHISGDAPDEFWHSSKITSRVSDRLLLTANGSLYKIVGDMDKETIYSEGSFPKDLIEKFSSGFPENWQSLIEESSQLSKPQKRKESLQWKKPSKKSKKKSQKLTPVHNNSFLAGIKESGTKEDPILIDSLPRTRSGRAVIPQLAWWTNQRVLIRPETKALQVVPGTPNTLPGETVLNFECDKRIQQLEEQAIQRKLQEKFASRKRKSTARQNDGSFVSAATSADTKAAKRAEWKSLRRKSSLCHQPPVNSKDGDQQSVSNSSLEDCPSAGTSRVVSSTDAHIIQTQATSESDSDAGKDMTAEERAYSESLKKAFEILEKKDSSFLSTDEDAKCDMDNSLKGDKQKENVDLVDFGLATEIEAMVSERKANREKKKQEVKNLRKPCYRSPHLHLTNVFEMKKNTPQILLKKALENMPSVKRKAFQANQKGQSVTSSNSVKLESKRVLRSRDKSRGTNSSKEIDAPPSAGVEESEECVRDVLSQDFFDNEHEEKKRPSNAKRKSQTISAKAKQKSSSSASRDPKNKASSSKTGPSSSSSPEVLEQNGGSEARPWTPEEIHRYETAYKELPLAEPWFWMAVSTSVGSRTEQECKEFHFRDAPSTAKKRKTTAKAPKELITEPSQITGGKGTLKRKRQIQELIENHNKDYSDDIFGSTPFKNMKHIQVPALSSSVMQSIAEDFQTPEAHKTPRSKRQKTNQYQTPHHPFPLQQPVSEKKTPMISNLISPGLPLTMNRKDLEGYVHRLKKNHRGRQWGVLPSKDKTSGPKQQSKKKNIADNIATELFHPDKKHEYDDSDSDDYYFSDND